MARLLFRIGLVLAGLGALLVFWVAGVRPLSLMLDRLHTGVIDSQPIAQFGVAEAESGMLRVNELPLSTAARNGEPFPLQMKVDPARDFVIETPGHAIVLGRVDDSLGLKPGPGDKARLRIERSLLSWPTPLEMNFMTGYSPSWKRNLYYRLTWEKPDGSRLEMVWRYEQYFYQDWASGFMTRPGTTGLIRVDIRP